MNKERLITILKAVGKFFKRTIAVWIIASLFLVASLGDYIYFRTFDLVLLSVEGTDHDSSLYYSTIDNDEMVYFSLLLTSNGKPVQGHSLVGIGKKGGQVKVPRIVTDEEGKATFEFAPNPQYREPPTLEGEIYVYDEDNSVIIEFRIERYFDITMVKRES